MAPVHKTQAIKTKTVKKSNIFSGEIFNTVLVFFIAYFVYLLTVYPTVGPEDSGELIVSAIKPDIAHPPGYPIHSILGWIFSKIIFFGNMGWRVNLLSAFFGAATIAVFYLLFKKLTKNTFIAFGAALFLAFTEIFWSQNIRTEVYPLSSFFFAAISYLLLIWDEKQEDKYLCWVAFLYGLSYTDSFMIMMLAGPPMVIYVLIRNWRVILNIKLIIKCILLFILGLTPYIYLPLRTWLAPYDNPAYIKHDGLYTWDKFLSFVNRNIYGGTMNTILPGTSATIREFDPVIGFAKAAGLEIFNIAKKFIDGTRNGFLTMTRIIIEQLVYFPVLLLIPGFHYLKTNFKKYSIYIFLCFFFYTVIQLGYLGIGPGMHPYTLHNNRPFYISAILITGLITLCGLVYPHDWIKQKIGKGKYYLLVIIIALIPLVSLAFNFYNNNESHNYLSYDFNKNVLASMPPNGFLLSIGRDQSTFPLYYLQEVEKYRTDVDVEIYYYANSPTRLFMENRMQAKNQPDIFIDLLPDFYDKVGVTPYNFIYKLAKPGEKADDSQSQADFNKYQLRGIRPEMDFPNTKAKGLYYLKTAIVYKNDTVKRDYWLMKTLKECSINPKFIDFMKDLVNGTYINGMF